MALIKCPECGGKVSDKANACIHCGYPLCETKHNGELLIETMMREKNMREKMLDDIVNGSKKIDLLGTTLPIGWYF